ncbi:MAG TPA: hypothetical protein VLA71_19015 [Algoriphagus sp.]|nr:hypothetical protein [Algoriphagus sp.]
MTSRFLLFLIVLFFHLSFGGRELYAQCSSCDVTISGNNSPSQTIQSNNVVCISGNRTTSIPVQNLNNITLCILPEATVNSNLLTNIGSLKAVNNYGTFILSNQPNQNNWIVSNFGTMSLTTSLNSNASIFNYSTLNVSNNPDINGTLISFGSMNVNGNIRFQSNTTSIISGTATVSGQLENNSSISLAGSLTAGSLKMGGGKKIEALNANQCNSITVSGEFYSDANNGITGNNLDYAGTGSALFVNKLPTGNANPKIAGGASIGSCPAVNCLTSKVITTSFGYDIVYIYKCSDTFVLPNLLEGEELLDVQVLVIGGGGGGGFGDAAGGGGAGGITYRKNLSLTPLQPYEVKVGRGELGALNGNMPGINGHSSDFNNLMPAFGGGGGGSTNFNNGNGNSGGYGGGGAFNGSSNGNGGQSQTNNSNKGGNAGNSGNGNQRSGGGGGGAFGPGNNGNGNNGGNGSDGVIIATSCNNCEPFSGILLDVDQGFLSSNGISTILAAGGGGVGSNPGNGNGGGIPSAGNGGSSVGGNGNRSGKGNNGIKNTGSGGGAGRDGGGSGGDGIVVIRITYRILPVEFLNFTAAFHSQKRSGILQWMIGKEWENSHFEIERAVNSIKSWEKIGEVVGQGFSEEPMEYTFEDSTLPLSGGNVFYRIKQVDFDGNHSYSTSRAIQLPPSGANEAWTIFPNPSISDSPIRIELLQPELYKDEKISFSLINQMGNAGSWEAESPEHVSSFVSEWLRKSPPGIYIVHIQWGIHSQRVKLIRR